MVSRWVVIAIAALAWLIALLWVITRTPEMVVFFVFLNAYVAAVAYGFTLWSKGDRDGTLAVVLAVLLPIPGWLILFLHFVDPRGNRDAK
jgi:hypothetical protein